MPQLAKPSAKYKESFLEARREFIDDKTYKYQHLPEVDAAGFEAYLNERTDHELGRNLPEGFVPASDFWLVEKDKYLGTTNIRHRLNQNLLDVGGHIGYHIRPSERRKGYGTLILKLALIEAKKLGLSRVLITCDEENIGSAKIIEKNGGVLENIFVQSNNLPNKKRYWIEI